MALTCDSILNPGGTRCTRVAVTHMHVELRDRVHSMDLCLPCAANLETTLIRSGSKVLNAKGGSVGYKTRAAYQAASGVTFTAKEAREWLVAQEPPLAEPRGRLSKEQLQAYADAH